MAIFYRYFTSFGIFPPYLSITDAVPRKSISLENVSLEPYPYPSLIFLFPQNTLFDYLQSKGMDIRCGFVMGFCMGSVPS